MGVGGWRSPGQDSAASETSALGGPPPGTATIRLSQHRTSLAHPTDFSALAVRHGQCTGEWGWGGPKEFDEALHTCGPIQGGVEAWGRRIPSQRGLPPGPLHWNWRQGMWGEEGWCLRENRRCPGGPLPCPLQEGAAWTHSWGRGQKCFLYMCIYFFLSSELSTRRFLPISAAVSVVISGRGRV